jgi:hypothetical protein
MRNIMKKFLITILILVTGMFLSSCNDNTTNPETPSAGTIYLTSVPPGALIWLNNVDQNKLTPDSLSGLNAGSYQVTLKLTGYLDTTFTITITAGKTDTKNIVLTTSLVTKSFVPVRLWETTGTSAQQPSGLQLSTGQAVSSSSPNADLLYYTNSGFTVHEIRSSSTRNTFFYVSNQTNLNDGEYSPIKEASWVNSFSDTETNYVFVYDNDHHYSKIKIVNVSSITESPAWVEIQGIYNQTADDPRF